MKKLKKCDIGGPTTTTQGIQSLNPWQFVNPNSEEVMYQVYNPVQAANAAAMMNSQAQTDPSSVETRTSSTFGSQPNWSYIFGSQMTQGVLNGLSHLSQNSRQNAQKRFNQEQFNPLNYLPRNPNTSLQDLYGMESGGTISPEKAKEMLRDGTAHGKKLTPKQKRYFGMIASGKKMADGGEMNDDWHFLFDDDDEDVQPPTVSKIEQVKAENQPDEDEQNKQGFEFLQQMFAKNKSPEQQDNYQIDPDQAVNAETIKQRLMLNGIPEHIASGFVGNFIAESSLNPGITNSIGAFGLGQWLGPRKKALETFANKQGRSVDDPLVQADFVAHELNTSESKAKEKIFAANDAVEAATSIMHYYERPSAKEKVSSLAKRISGAVAAAGYGNGGEVKPEDYNMKRALELGYKADETGHWPSVDSETGEWLKSKNHPTRGMELMQYLLNPELNKNLQLFENENGNMQYRDREEDEEMKKGGFKLNPKHKGWCTPMTKSTCTGKRRQFALNAKNHFKKHKKEQGGFYEGEEYDISPDEVEALKKLGYKIEIL